MVAEGKAPSEQMGIVISYSVRVKLNCGTLGGELVTDVPVKLMHPASGKFLYIFLRCGNCLIISHIYIYNQRLDIILHVMLSIMLIKKFGFNLIFLQAGAIMNAQFDFTALVTKKLFLT